MAEKDSLQDDTTKNDGQKEEIQEQESEKLFKVVRDPCQKITLLLLKSNARSQDKTYVISYCMPAKSDGEWLHKYFARAFGISNEPTPECLLDEMTLAGIAKYIASDKCQKIITMAGAGISTSAGIPDYRSSGSGIYDNLQKYNLDNPKDVFTIDFFKERPEIFFEVARDRDVLWSKVYKPTPCHYFLRLLEQKNKLLKHFTQNIDALERLAGLSSDKIIEAHGTVCTASCLQCQRKYSQEWMKQRVFSDEVDVPRCDTEKCRGVVKPDVVFFGEPLPDYFHKSVHLVDECDLLIILGTSLVVQPFASITNRVKPNTPRLYINLEKSGNENSHPMMVLLFGGGFDFDKEENIRDVFYQGTCDDGCQALADFIGWGDELRQLVKDEHEKLATVVTTTETSQATYKGMPAKDAYIANCSKPSPAKPCKPTSKTVKRSSKQ